METVKIALKKRDPNIPAPVYQTKLAAGADVCADLEQPLEILSQNFALIPTGLFFEIPEGFEIQVRPRSGLALKFGITVLNTPGTIDADYRGELKVLLINHGKEPFVVEPKMRIAQIVVAKVEQGAFFEANALSDTERGSNGFGHTGLKTCT
jgi:dUTP pyrophosphatase